MRGPLPVEGRRRRNKPTIPTTRLPLGGRVGSVPVVPSWVSLGVAGRAWWVWAWGTPQAAAWGVGVGQESVVARRALLEDVLAGLQPDPGAKGSSSAPKSEAKLGVTVRLQILREMRELDDRLGLTPKGMAALRWVVVDDAESKVPAEPPKGVSNLSARRARLTDAS